MRYKVIDRSFYKNMTFLTLAGSIQPIRVGEEINGGAAQVLSSIIPGNSTPDDPQILLVVSGKLKDDEVYY